MSSKGKMKIINYRGKDKRAKFNRRISKKMNWKEDIIINRWVR